MIDLCIDARMAFSSGIGTYIRQLVPLLTDFRITLLVDRIGSDWCRKFEQIHFPVPIYSIQEQALFPIKVPRCDLFWSPHYNIPLLPIRARKRVVTIHDACHLALGSWHQRVYAKMVMGKALHGSAKVITDSQFSKEEVYRYLGRSKKEVEVIQIAVNREIYFRRNASDEIRKKYRLPEKFILFVGNHKPHKNIEGLVLAFSKLKIPNLGLVVVGKGTATGEVLDKELPILYSMAEAFILPSFYEGFGLPPLEAMSCGCPTLVSRAASLPEVCGDASLYFDPWNAVEMAEAIQRVVANQTLRDELIQKGYERVQSFSWAKTAERHRQIFEEVCHA